MRKSEFKVYGGGGSVGTGHDTELAFMENNSARYRWGFWAQVPVGLGGSCVLAADDDYIYSTTSGGPAGQSIIRINRDNHAIDGAQYTGLNATGGTGIAVDANFIYLISGGKIYHAPIAGGAFSLLWQRNNVNFGRGMMLYQGKLYTFGSNGVQSIFYLMSMAADGTGAITDVLPPNGPGPPIPPSYGVGITTDGTYLYLATGNRYVSRVKLDGTGYIRQWWDTTLTDGVSPSDVAYDFPGANIYANDMQNSQIIYTPVNAPAVPTVAPIGAGASPIGLCFTPS